MLLASLSVGEGPKTAVLVPLKSFASAKAQLAETCSESQREHLSRTLAQNVLQSARGLRAVVIAGPDALDVQRFALVNGARFITTSLDLSDVDLVIEHGVKELHDLGYQRVVIINADLPSICDLKWLINSDGITFVANSSGHGTNAICMPTNIGFPFSLLETSFATNQEIAEGLGVDYKAVVDPGRVSVNIRNREDAIHFGLLDDSNPQVASATPS